MKRVTQFAVHPGWRLLISDIGVNPDDVLRLAGLPLDLFSRKDAMVNTAQYFQIWHALEQVDGTQILPLKVGKAISVEAFDPAIFASLCSPNLNIALQRLSSFKKLIGPMVLNVDVGQERTAIRLECYGEDVLIPQNLAVTELVFITQLVRLGTRYRVVPKEIVLPELPEQIEAYTDYFGVTPRRGKQTIVSFYKQDGVRPFLTANESMWEFFEGSLRKRLSTLDSTAKMSDRVKAVLLEGLPAGQSSMDFVAKQLAVSTRTLQRQLNEESSSFTDILSDTRHQLATHYLRKPNMSQGEIAYLLGFQDVNSFNRAFKDWAGITPGTYRHQEAVH